MKKFLFIFLLGLFSNAYSQEVNFIQNDWEAARKLSQETNKPLFVDFYTDWSSWCKVMDKKTFSDEAVANYMNENFVCLKIDAEKDYGVNLAVRSRYYLLPMPPPARISPA